MENRKKGKFETVSIFKKIRGKDTINIKIKEINLMLSVKKSEQPWAYDRLSHLVEIPRCEKCGRAIQDHFYITGENNYHRECFKEMQQQMNETPFLL